MPGLKTMIEVPEQAARDQVGTEVFTNDDQLLSSPLSSVPSDFDEQDRPDFPLAVSSPPRRRGPPELEAEGKPDFRNAPTDPLKTGLLPVSDREGESHVSPAASPLSREQNDPAIESEQTPGGPPNGSTQLLGPIPELPAHPSQEQDRSNHQECTELDSLFPAASSRKRPRPLEMDGACETELGSPTASTTEKERADSPQSKRQRTDVDESNSAAVSARVKGTPNRLDLSSPPSALSLRGPQGEEPSIPSARPSRKRAAPTRYNDELGSSSKSAKTAGPRTAGPKAVNRNLRKGCWNTDYLLQNPKSKLVYANLFGVLSDERAWTLLSPEEQRQLLAMLPEPVVTEASDGQALPNPFQEYLKNNNAFQADVRLFQEDLSAGRYNGKWLADAKAAMTKRAEGKFDGWKEQQTEAFWGQKQKLYHKALAGDSTTCKLATLVAAQCFSVGDVWSYSRGFGRKKADAIVVEKEAKIIDISATNGLSFTIPPGHHKLSSPANGDDVVVNDISGPQQLSTAILKEDGRITDPPNGNAWKDFRCWRDNQDIGSIWEIREAYYLRSNGMT